MVKGSLRSNKPIANRSKSKKYNSNKQERQIIKHDKINEKTPKINNESKISQKYREREKLWEYEGMDRRMGGKGSQRIKQKKERSKISIDPKSHKYYPKGECVVCFERIKMKPDNTIDCHNVTHPLCMDCKGKMKKDVCPLCNSHSIGIEPIETLTNYMYRTGNTYRIGQFRNRSLILYREYISDASYDWMDWVASSLR